MFLFRSFFRFFSLDSFWWESLRKYSEELKEIKPYIFLRLWICSCSRSFQKLPFAYIPANSCFYKFIRIEWKTQVSKSFLIKGQTSGLQLHLKRVFDTSVFLCVLQFFLKNTPGGCFCLFTENKKIK